MMNVHVISPRRFRVDIIVSWIEGKLPRELDRPFRQGQGIGDVHGVGIVIMYRFYDQPTSKI